MFLGSWPQPALSDPKYIAPGDWLMSVLYIAVLPLLAGSLAAVFALPAFAIYLRRWIQWHWLLAALLLFSLSFWLLFLDPMDRLSWFAD